MEMESSNLPSDKLDDYLDINDLTRSEKLDRALLLKERGTKKFKDNLFQDAHRDYHQAFKFLVATSPPPSEINGAAVHGGIDDGADEGDVVDPAKIKDLKCALYLNIAACLQVILRIYQFV